MKTYRVGIIGCGRSAWDLHAPLLERHPRFSIVAAYSFNTVNAQRFAARFGGVACQSMEELFSAGIDLAVILTPNSTHADIAIACMEHGVDVLVTKPWAVSTAEADRMINTSLQYDKQVMEFLPMLWETDLQLLKKEVAAGAIGKVFQIRRCEGSFGRRNDWQTLSAYGGGYLNNWGPHLIGQAMALAGSPVASAYGYTRKLINPGDAEDLFFAMLKTADGILMNVEYNVMTPCMPRWIVQGSRGTMHIAGDTLIVETVRQPESVTADAYRDAFSVDKREIPFERIDRAIIYDDIAAALDGEKPYGALPAFSRQLTRVIEAVRVASHTNQPQIL